MNILLINPPNCGRSLPEERYGIAGIKLIFRGEPLSLETLAGNLGQHAVAIADLKADADVLSPDKLPFTPDLIGLTGVTCEANTMLAHTKALKSRFAAVIVVGGQHASCDPFFFATPCVDYVVVGLGKRSFRDLVDMLEAQKTHAIDGILPIVNGAAQPFTPRAMSVADLLSQCLAPLHAHGGSGKNEEKAPS